MAPATKPACPTPLITSSCWSSTMQVALPRTFGIPRIRSWASDSATRSRRRWCTTSRMSCWRVCGISKSPPEGGPFARGVRLQPDLHNRGFLEPEALLEAIDEAWFFPPRRINLHEDVQALVDGSHDADAETLHCRRKRLLGLPPDENRARPRIDDDVET